MITVFAMAKQIVSAEHFMSGEQTGKSGKAVSIKRHGQGVRIGLVGGESVTWVIEAGLVLCEDWQDKVVHAVHALWATPALLTS